MVLFKKIARPVKRSKAQSAVELTLIFTVLLFLLTTMVEFGILLNTYITVQDAARTGAREAAVADPIVNPALFFNTDFGVPKITNNALLPLTLDTTCANPATDPCDDMIISVFSVRSGQTPTRLYNVSVYGNKSTQFTPAQIGARLDAGAPNTGLVVIEIFYSYRQWLNMPWTGTDFFENDNELIPFRVFAIMPLSAAEPTPTPRP